MLQNWRTAMYVTRIVWTPFGWQVVPVWVGAFPVQPTVVTPYGYAYAPGYGYGGAQVWTGPMYAQRGAGRLLP